MPLEKFIAAQKQQIEGFLADETLKLLRIAVDSEAEPLVVKLLSAIDANPRNRDIFIGIEKAFEQPASFYAHISARCVEEHHAVQAALEREGIRCALPASMTAPEGPGTRSVEARFAAEIDKFARSFAGRAQHLVVVIAPPEETRPEALCPSLRALLDALPTDRVKL